MRHILLVAGPFGAFPLVGWTFTGETGQALQIARKHASRCQRPIKVESWIDGDVAVVHYVEKPGIALESYLPAAPGDLYS